MTWPVSRALSTVALGLLVSCAGCTHAHRVVNTGNSMLYAVTVKSGERRFGHGYLPPKASKTYTGSMPILRAPAPVVSWKMSEAGPPIAREVPLDRSPGRREVCFEIDGETVTLVFRPR
jgi:hypothetical protein